MTRVGVLLNEAVQLRLIERRVLVFAEALENARLVVDADKDHSAVTGIGKREDVFGDLALLVMACQIP
jgi:hypothetical protein